MRTHQKVKLFSVGLMNIECVYCGALFFKNEIMNCCKSNSLTRILKKYDLKPNDIPELIKQLFDRQHEFSDEFILNIRHYNNIFSFVSTGIQPPGKIIIDQTMNGFTFICDGWPVHYIGSMIPLDKHQSKFSQIYLLESNQQIEIRSKIYKNYKVHLNEKLIELLQLMFFKYNQLVKKYHQIGKFFKLRISYHSN